MIRIAFFQNDIGVGGIQKSIINLLKNIDYDEFAVDLYVFDNDGNDFWHADFPKQLQVIHLKPIPLIYKYLPFELAMRNCQYDFQGREYDLAVDFNSYQPSCALGAIQVPAKKRVMWIHNNVEIKYANEWKYRVLWNAFKGKLKYFDAFVPCSNALEAPFRKLSGIQDREFPVIENYIDSSEILRKAEETPENFAVDPNLLNFVALGRLCHQKGYDIMLDLFSKASAERDDLHLYIIGDGPDAEELHRLAGPNVTFLGNRTNPYCYMKLCDAFISTSRYEGQPLNIKEAEVLGLPLYCTKNLEAYSDGLKGKDDLLSAIIGAQKEDKHPDLLEEYNGNILNKIKKLAT